MKRMRIRILVVVLLTCGPGFARAALMASWNGSQAITETSGVAFPCTLSSSQTTIPDLSVTLNISGGCNGDLFAYLSHDGGYAVLLNRVGRSSIDDLGSSTSGFAVTLTSRAAPDIHNSQNLSPSYNGAGQLTGNSGADGRDVRPDLSFDSTPRTAGLNSFNGLDPNGAWVIYFYDASLGGVSTLNGWSVEVQAVPEPVNAALGLFSVFFAFAVLWRWLGWKRKLESA